MAVRRSSRACPGRLLPLLVAASLGLSHVAMADDATPAAPAPATVPPATSPIVAPATGQAGPAPVAKPAPPVAVVNAAPPKKAGDRADAIARDVVLHAPQKQMPEPDVSSLRTLKLKLGGLLDRSVHGPEDTEVGRVIDVMLGEDGKPAALEMDVGGFMGVGNRKIVVAWALFDIPKPASTDPIRLSLTDAQVKSAPSAEESGEVTIVTGVVPHVAVAASVPPAKADAPPAKVDGPVAPAPASPAPPASALPQAPDPVEPGSVTQGPAPATPGTAEKGTTAHPPGGQP